MKNLPAMAEFEVLSHTFRGLALRDPYAVTKLLNKDKEIMDVLATARNKICSWYATAFRTKTRNTAKSKIK